MAAGQLKSAISPWCALQGEGEYQYLYSETCFILFPVVLGNLTITPAPPSLSSAPP